MFLRYFFITSLCFLVVASVAGAQANLLLNPSFEDPGYPADPSSWAKFDIDPIDAGTWNTGPYDGSWFIRKAMNGSTGAGGVAQAFTVTSGLPYSATVYVTGDWQEGTPATVRGRVGLDPTAQTSNINAETIQWGEWVSCATQGLWLPATVTDITATGGTMSIFCNGEIQGHGTSYWALWAVDAAEVPGVEAPPTPTATPIPLIGDLNFGFDDPYTGAFNDTIASTWRAWWIVAASSEAVNGYAMAKPEAFWRSPDGMQGEAQQIWRSSSSSNIDAGLYAPAVIEPGVQFQLSCYFMKDTNDEEPGLASDRLVNIGFDFSHTGQPIGDRSPGAFPSVTWASELEEMGDHNPGLDANALGASAGFDEWFQISTDLIESTGSDITLFVEVMGAVPVNLQEFFIDQMGLVKTSTGVEKEHWSLFR